MQARKIKLDTDNIEKAAGFKAALYLRVSTGRQAEHDLSIPDQRAQTAG